MSQMYRARALISWRKPTTNADDIRLNVNQNPLQHVQPNERFDPAEIGLTKAELDRMAAAGHVIALGGEGENLDRAETVIAAASYGGPKPVPSTTERDANSKGAAAETNPSRAQAHGSMPQGTGIAQGNTSEPPNAGNQKPGEGANVSGPGAQTAGGKIGTK